MIRLATVFSGIGAIEHALNRMGLEHKIVFACDNGDVDVLSKRIKDYSKDSLEKELREFHNELSYSTVSVEKYSNAIKEIKMDYVLINELVASLGNVIETKDEIKKAKEIASKISMLFEKLRTVMVHQKLEGLSFVDKKKYVDSLYESKKSQNKVMASYMANYNIGKDDFHWNVSFLDGRQYENQVDLFVGGSPCQSFSLVGKQRGLEDTRGTLFYEFVRLVSEINPKVFIYENVRAVLSNDNGNTWNVMCNAFDELGYKWDYKVLNAKDYGIPQNRERLFVVGFREDLSLKESFEFPVAQILDKVMQDFLLENVAEKYYLPPKGVKFVTDEKNLLKRYTQIDGDVQLCQKKNQQFNWHGDFVSVERTEEKVKAIKQNLEKYFLSEKVEKYVLSSGTKGFYSKPETDLEVARPLLTTMHKMHRAGVDNYVTTDGRLRKLTPRECLRLMGFCDSFKINVSDTSMYQQAGNSIVVDVLIAIMKRVLCSYDFEGAVFNE